MANTGPRGKNVSLLLDRFRAGAATCPTSNGTDLRSDVLYLAYLGRAYLALAGKGEEA